MATEGAGSFPDGGAAGAGCSVTVAEADFVASAWLVAVMAIVCEAAIVAGAV